MASGSIRKRVGKRGTTYQVIIERGLKPDGSRWQESRTFKRRRDAEDYRTKTLHELNTGVYVTPSTTPLDQYAEHWFDTISVRQSSLVRYRSIYQNHISPAFGSTAIGAITTTDVQTWLNDKRRRYQSAIAMLVQLNAILSLAVSQRLIPSNPCDGVRRQKSRDESSSERRIKTWTPEQLTTFLDATRDDPDWPAWWVAAYTGLRPGELVALRWSDIDLTARTLTVSGTRTVINEAGHWIIGEVAKNAHSARTIGIDPETTRVLASQRATQNARRLAIGPYWQPHDMVFDIGDGAPQDGKSLSRRFARRTIACGLPRLTLHGLRATHGSLLAMSGRPLNYIQKRLGHATLETTSRYYLHLIAGTEHDDADAFAAMLRRARGG